MTEFRSFGTFLHSFATLSSSKLSEDSSALVPSLSDIEILGPSVASASVQYLTHHEGGYQLKLVGVYIKTRR